ncbi:hypothetical protein V8C86DRAFT_1806347 [Haematococcus lacustris]
MQSGTRHQAHQPPYLGTKALPFLIHTSLCAQCHRGLSKRCDSTPSVIRVSIPGYATAISQQRSCGIVASSRQSVDPLSVSDGIYRPGKTYMVADKAELDTFLAQTPDNPYKDKLVILMAKSSHCRPCKKFQSVYNMLARRFADCLVLEVMGDASPDNRKMMMDMAVKVTPTFFLYRGGQRVHSLTGTSRGALARAILERLQPGETGREWQEPVVTADSDDDE